MPETPTGPGRPQEGGRVRPVVALVFATVLFLALIIGGVGILSLYRDEEPISAPGFGILPGALGVIVSAGAFAAVIWAVLRRPHPSFWGALWTAAASFLAYLAAIVVFGAASSDDPLLAVAVAGRLVTQGFAIVVAASALVCGWGAIALVRSHGGRPRWPWEDENDV